jgi:hypothetical protein
MSYVRDLLATEERWDALPSETITSLPKGTTVALQVARTVSNLGVTFQPMSTKLDAEGRFTLRLTSLRTPPDAELLLRGQVFIAPTVHA